MTEAATQTKMEALGVQVGIDTDAKNGVIVSLKGEFDNAVLWGGTIITRAADGALVITVPGQKMKDGSIYAGLTEDGKQQIFAMPQDFDVAVTFNDAAQPIKSLNAENALGHNDWQIGSIDVMRILQKNQNEGSLSGTFKKASSGGYDPDWYLTATPHGNNSQSLVRRIRFSDGAEYLWARKDASSLNCRPVRLVPLEFKKG